MGDKNSKKPKGFGKTKKGTQEETDIIDNVLDAGTVSKKK